MAESQAVELHQPAGSITVSEDSISASTSNPRSNPRKRRLWLRDLDAVLASELEEAGSLSCAELIELATRPLAGHGSPGVIEEWWEYAYRRRWLEEREGNRCSLSAVGQADLHRQRQSDAYLDPLIVGKEILKWLLPAGTVGAAVYLTGRFPKQAVTIFVSAILIGVGLILASPFTRWINRISDRHAARRACDWLDDHPVRLAPNGARQAQRADRLYSLDDRSAPGFSQP